MRSSKKADAARYEVKIPEDDVYSVYAWWPEKLGKKASARVGVETDSGTKWSRLDQSRDGGYWVPVGEYEMKKGDRNTVQVAPSNKAGGFAVADAVAVVRGVTAFPPAPPEKKIGGAEADEATFSGAAVTKKADSQKGSNDTGEKANRYPVR